MAFNIVPIRFSKRLKIVRYFCDSSWLVTSLYRSKNTFASFPTIMILISSRYDLGNPETESQLYINTE